MENFKDLEIEKTTKEKVVFDFNLLYKSEEVNTYHSNKITFLPSEVNQYLGEIMENEPPLSFLSAQSLIKCIISDPNIIFAFQEKHLITYLEMIHCIPYQRSCLIVFNLIFQAASQLNCLDPIIHSDLFSVLENMIIDPVDFETFYNALNCICIACETGIPAIHEIILSTNIFELLRTQNYPDVKFNDHMCNSIIRLIKVNYENFDPIDFFQDFAMETLLNPNDRWPGYGAMIITAFIERVPEIVENLFTVEGFYEHLTQYMLHQDIRLRNTALKLLLTISNVDASKILISAEFLDCLLFIVQNYQNNDTVHILYNVICNSDRNLIMNSFPAENFKNLFCSSMIELKKDLLNILVVIANTFSSDYISIIFNNDLIDAICEMIGLDNDEINIKIADILFKAINTMQNQEFTQNIYKYLDDNDAFDTLDDIESEEGAAIVSKLRNCFGSDV